MTTKTKVIAGVLGALAAGVVVGLLIAPEKGKDTRKKLRKMAGEWADSLSNLLSQGKDIVDDLQEETMEVKAAVEKSAGKAKKSVAH